MSIPLNRSLPYVLITGGAVGLIASFILTLEKIWTLMNPDYIPPCNISPFVSCGSVMDSVYGSLFGFPNSLLGIAGFAAVITIGFTILAGAQFKRWFWIALQTGMTMALLSVFALAFISIFIIGSLCPFCMVFWAATIALYSTVTVYNLKQDNLPMPKIFNPGVTLTLKYNWLPFVVLYGIIVITIVVKFWSYIV
jgi:uncharacterized membrane protein